MTRFKTALLLATVASAALITSAASAQTLIAATPGQTPTVGNGTDTAGNQQFALLVTGASSVVNVVLQEKNCIKGTTCSPALQPNFDLLYESEGSGFGRQQWRNFTNQWPVASLPNSQGTWSHVQFAFADSSITLSDLNTYNTNVKPTAGAGIMFPKYILPVAIAYNPVYGQNASGVDMRFRVNFPQAINSVTAGGLRLTRELYCGIFNGDITNFNDSRFAAQNGSFTLQDTTNDTSTRWTQDGVPIRMVGRLEKSGTTDIFTRALAAQCNGLTGITNKYTANAESLPYNRATAGAASPDFGVVRPDTALQAASTDPVAGTTNLISNQYFNGTAITSLNVTGGSPATPVGNQGSGRFLVAIGSGLVRDAINLAPDYSTTTNPLVKLNGKIGYIASDFIVNSPTGSPTLFAAALRVLPSSGAFNMPSAVNGSSALNAIRPPEADPTTGVYTNTDDRLVRNPAGGANIVAKRQNPFAWYDVLYTTSATQSVTLADPQTGYPIVGTTQFLGNTCYTSKNREHVVNFLGWNTNGVTRDYQNADRTGVVRTLVTNSNIGATNTPWSHAIVETFLTDSNETALSQRLGDLKLWIQSTPVPGGTANPDTTNGCGGGKTGA
ncbi:substrate-binding domain-containing protein [Sphingomonas sp. QA11]|uniref:substrate-binding domain-containing protein n=1 Tax=Sphingomonas sp. QA11 TaxID=2950605 RepID=UPI00234B8817|nr:substrate-binding domain-containing protein [Sphingomonas sp. QA11]WCM28027.1 substrate-binding domain-containing protein [Sphingomonas sp. QA11]